MPGRDFGRAVPVGPPDRGRPERCVMLSKPRSSPRPRREKLMRVVIVDDHPVTRDGLRAALSTSEDIDIVGEADSGEEAINKVNRLEPTILIMDVRMPGIGATEATKA